jgi:hypothetical protein
MELDKVRVITGTRYEERRFRRSEKREGVSMTMVAVGLLLGMVGLVWVMVIDIMQADHQTKRESPREQDKPLAEVARCESKAADRVPV